MERQTHTIECDTLRYFPDEWTLQLFDDSHEKFDEMIGELEFDCDDGLRVEFDEYYATFTADTIHVTVSYFERSDEYGVYNEDYQVESVEVFE